MTAVDLDYFGTRFKVVLDPKAYPYIIAQAAKAAR